MEDQEAGDHDIWLMRPEIRERLLQLKASRDYHERLRAGLQAQAEAELRANAAGQEIAGRVAEAVLEAGLRAKVECLTLFFAVKADEPTEYAVSRISSCRDIAQATEWLHRAYKGETAAEIFLESESWPGGIADAAYGVGRVWAPRRSFRVLRCTPRLPVSIMLSEINGRSRLELCNMVAMSNPSSQHQAVCALVEEYPELVRELASLTGVEIPERGRPVAAPASYPMSDGSTIHGDATVHLRDEDGTARFFAQVEMQNQYSLGKLATLRAYHGGEVRRSKCGGHMWVLSPKGSETRKFRENEALRREEYAFRASYLSGGDLVPFADPSSPLPSRALAAVMTDMENDGVPRGARALLLELQGDGKDRVADLILDAILEKCADISDLEVGMNDAAMERLMTLPSFRDAMERRLAEREARVKAKDLVTYFAARGETPSADELATLNACDDPVILESWLQRAYSGESAAQILKKH